MDVRIQYINFSRPGSPRLQWTLIDPETDQLTGSTYTVSRSGVGTGDWDVVATGLTGIYFEDSLVDSSDDSVEVNHLSITREMWYRVTLVLVSGVSVHSSAMNTYGETYTEYPEYDGIGISPVNAETQPGGPTLFQANPELNRRLMLIQRNVQRRAMIALRYFTGVTVHVLKRKHFGTRCLSCFHPLLKTVMVENCVHCYGTGFVGGYYAPILAVAKITESPPQKGFTRTGPSELIVGQIELVDFPRIEQDDIIVEVATLHRWNVRDSLRAANLRRNTVTQHFRCSMLGPKDPAYSVPVEQDARLP